MRSRTSKHRVRVFWVAIAALLCVSAGCAQSGGVDGQEPKSAVRLEPERPDWAGEGELPSTAGELLADRELGSIGKFLLLQRVFDFRVEAEALACVGGDGSRVARIDVPISGSIIDSQIYHAEVQGVNSGKFQVCQRDALEDLDLRLKNYVGRSGLAVWRRAAAALQSEFLDSATMQNALRDWAACTCKSHSGDCRNRGQVESQLRSELRGAQSIAQARSIESSFMAESRKCGSPVLRLVRADNPKIERVLVENRDVVDKLLVAASEA